MGFLFNMTTKRTSYLLRKLWGFRIKNAVLTSETFETFATF